MKPIDKVCRRGDLVLVFSRPKLLKGEGELSPMSGSKQKKKRKHKRKNHKEEVEEPLLSSTTLQQQVGEPLLSSTTLLPSHNCCQRDGFDSAWDASPDSKHELNPVAVYAIACCELPEGKSATDGVAGKMATKETLKEFVNQLPDTGVNRCCTKKPPAVQMTNSPEKSTTLLPSLEAKGVVNWTPDVERFSRVVRLLHCCLCCCRSSGSLK